MCKNFNLVKLAQIIVLTFLVFVWKNVTSLSLCEDFINFWSNVGVEETFCELHFDKMS